ncbi:protein kinase domain-containing protein [Ramlibacter sp. PS4R-6]|uniref:protein kinase domain-containing protein n=1 Tax=Ramlibacter sp. PS4R-6 TaxID=3133438 RepID=UPI00309F32BC
MTTILIVEDDDAIRNNVIRMLKLEGYEIVSATNGRQGLERARAERPDLIISDIGMPEMDGFEMLEAIRADDVLGSTSVMLLTALDDRASMRRGMTAGADDYLAKPFTRVELLDALQGLLKKKGRIEASIESAVREREEHLRRAFTESLGGRALPDKFALAPPKGAITDTVVEATVLFSDIRGFTSLAEKLSSREVAELLTEYFDRICEPVLKNGGQHLRFIGDGLMAVFSDNMVETSPLPAARRAISAALGMALSTQDYRSWLGQRFAQRGLPAFAIGIGLHCGEVTIARLGTTNNKETTPIGDTVNMAARLESASKELNWTVVASNVVLEHAGEGVLTGGITSLEVRAKNVFMDVAEIVGLDASEEDKLFGMATLADRANEVREAVQINSEMTARAVKGALQSKLSAFKDFAPGDEPLRLKGYRLTRKIGSGGMTEVFLAVREADGLPVVLKVLDASGKATSEHLSRFIQEYTILSRIDHPNVIRIYDQGFTDDHAYIAMEYFEHGDLRAEIKMGMTPSRVVEIVREVALALEAIHERGIIHRDLKPENVMRRPDGTVALADFGIAKSMMQQENMALTQTKHGDVVGTPYYLSPEQASGQAITTQSDLYSLGVMMFEMLTGQRPFRAETLNLLLAHHVSAPTPRLPEAHAALQPVVDRLMAKKPADRYASARELLDDFAEGALSRTLVERR